MRIDWEELFTVATDARTRAWAEYSNFKVGAAILCADGAIIAGCNVENASYGLTLCAERNAIGSMVLEGKQPIAVAIVTDAAQPTPPCGMCRQVLAEFAPLNVPVRSRTMQGRELKSTVGALLPHAFTGAWLKKKRR